MQTQRIKKWVFRSVGVVLVLIMLAVLALSLLINRTMDLVYGGQTSVVDHNLFQIEAQPVAITGVSLLSPDGTEMLADRTVLIENGHIVAVDHRGSVPEGMSTIDGRGKYLIPGLTDSHVHLQRSANDLLLYVANGVTQIRSMGGSDFDLELKREIEAGRIGPHYYVSSPSMNSADGFGSAADTFPSWIPDSVAIWMAENMYRIHISLSAPESAEDAKSFIESGYDGIKLYGFLTAESYRAILDAADELGVPTAGHIPDDIPLSELESIKLGEIAHIEEIVKKLQGEFESGLFPFEGDFLEYVESRKDKIAADLASNDIAVHSTLWLAESFQRQVYDLENKLAEIELEYANPGIVEGVPASASGSVFGGWLPGRNKFQTYAGNTPEDIESSKNYWRNFEDAHRRLAKAMIDSGVTILAATDATAWLVIAGFSLHDELETLTNAGMTPAQALYSATAAPAQIINNNAGVIDVGYRADLVLLNQNPLEHIANTRSIDTVILKGKVLDRAMLDGMLEAVRVANGSSRTMDISLYQ